MHVFGFKGSGGWYALLAKDDIQALPEEYGPWKKFNEMELSPGDPDTVGVPTAQALDNLETLGGHLFQLNMTFE